MSHLIKSASMFCCVLALVKIEEEVDSLGGNLIRHDGDLASTTKGCKNVNDLLDFLPVTRGERDAKSFGTQLSKWCGSSLRTNRGKFEDGVSESSSCPICVDCAPGLWVHWNDRGGDFDLRLGGEEDVKEQTCRKSSLMNIAGWEALGWGLGALLGPLEGACSRVGVKTISRTHMAVLHGLGIEQLSAQDSSWFRCDDFLTLPLRVAGGSMPLYRSVYGDGFSYVEEDDCATFEARLQAAADGAKARRILARTNALPFALPRGKLDCTADAHDDLELAEIRTEYAAFMGELPDEMKKLLSVCKQFVVDVEKVIELDICEGR